MTALRLADFTPARTDQLLRLWRASFEHGVGITDWHPLEEQRAYFEREVLPSHRVRVALEDEALVGFVASNAESIGQLYVHVAHLGRGIGRALLRSAQAASGGRLWLYTFACNAGACAFYERHGFVATARGFEPHWQLEDVRYEWHE